MSPNAVRSCTAFSGDRRVAAGSVVEVAKKVKKHADRNRPDMILIFDDVTAEQVEIDFRGSISDVLARLSETAPVTSAPEREEPRGRGRPKLGVVAREVT